MITPSNANSGSREPLSPPARPGTGLLLTSTAVGAALSAPPAGSVFDHAWRPFPRAQAVAFNLGTVQSLAGDGPLEPKISVNGQLVPMSGKDGKSPVALALDAGVANEDGISFAVLEVEPNDDGELLKASRIEIVHSLNTTSREKGLGRKAIAHLTWNKGSVVRVRPMVNFHFLYVRVVPTSGGGLPRHFFL